MLQFTQKYRGHQGDVEIFSIDKLPNNAKQVAKTFFAKSEKSGHAHALCGDYELFEVDGGHIIKVGTDGATLNHTGYANLTPEYWNKNSVLPVADHKPTLLSEGLYYVGIQRRKKHFSKTWEKVRD